MFCFPSPLFFHLFQGKLFDKWDGWVALCNRQEAEIDVLKSIHLAKGLYLQKENITLPQGWQFLNLNPLQFMYSHWILFISPHPHSPFFGDCQFGRGELNWWVSLSPVTASPLCSQAQRAATVFALSPDSRMFNVFLSFPCSIRLVSTSLSEAKEEKALENIHIHTKWSSSGVSQSPSDLGVCSWTCFLFLSSCSFFRVIFIFIPHKTRGLWRPQSAWTILDLMESSSD